MWLRLIQGHAKDRAKLASTLHACSVFLAVVTRVKMVGMFSPSAIPPQLSYLLAALGVHTMAGVLNRRSLMDAEPETKKPYLWDR